MEEELPTIIPDWTLALQEIITLSEKGWAELFSILCWKKDFE